MIRFKANVEIAYFLDKEGRFFERLRNFEFPFALDEKAPSPEACTSFGMDSMNSGAEILQAMLLGKIEGLHPETLFLFSKTGLIHLFSASGFHMASAHFLAKVLIFPLRYLPKSTHHFSRFLFPSLFLFGFASLTEFSSPLVRALSFALFYQLSYFLESPLSVWRCFWFSCGISLLFGSSSTLSFFLSVVGTAGILLSPKKNLVWMTLSPWAFTAPLVIFVFHQFSLSAPLWNLSFGLVWSFTLLPVAIVSLLFQQVGIPTEIMDQWNAHLMELSVRLLQYLSSTFDVTFWIQPWHFVLASICGWIFYKGKPWPLALLLLLVIARGSLQFIVLDVGQGDALLLKNQRGETILVDGGNGSDRFSLGSKALERAGIGSVDHLFLSHLDQDHVGGVPLLLLKHSVSNVWVRKEFLEDPHWKKLEPFLAHLPLRFYETDSLEGVKCFLPSAVNKNESSPICEIQLDERSSFWITGDSGMKSENAFLQANFNGESKDRKNKPLRFLKLGHHGSRHSSSLGFLGTLDPQWAFISAAKKNRYGHPHQEVLDRLERLQIPFLETSRWGSIYGFKFGWITNENFTKLSKTKPDS